MVAIEIKVPHHSCVKLGSGYVGVLKKYEMLFSACRFLCSSVDDLVLWDMMPINI